MQSESSRASICCSLFSSRRISDHEKTQCCPKARRLLWKVKGKFFHFWLLHRSDNNSVSTYNQQSKFSKQTNHSRAHFMLTKLSTSMLEFTAHCKVPMMFMANVRIMPTLPGPSPAKGKRFNVYENIWPTKFTKWIYISYTA